MILAILATNLNDYVNLAIAVGTLAGIIGAALWKLRGLIRHDNQATIREELAPFVQTQADHGRDIASLKDWRPSVDAKLTTHAEGIAYLRGKEDARAELAQGLSGVSHIADVLKGPEERKE